MTETTFTKTVDDIEEPELMEEDWYKARVVTDPVIEDNKAAKAGLPPEDGAGKNYIVKFKLEHKEPKINGRRFTAWLPYPVPEDEDKYDGMGNKVYDKKMGRIMALADCAQGSVLDGKTATVMPNSLVMVYVTRGLDMNGENIINSIDAFRDPPFKRVEG